MNNFKNLKYIPTDKIQEILNDPYCRGNTGKDYYPVKEELETILYERLADREQKKYEQLEKDYNEQS